MQITLMNRQRRVRFDVGWLRGFADAALADCAQHSGDGLFLLKEKAVVEVAVVSDSVIARVHREFMGIEGATDVITFDHGEIVVSAETAKRCAGEHGHSVAEELGLYIVHGLLHLNGFDDREDRARRRMRRVQDRIWRRLRERMPKQRPGKG
jgi:probable rRNA maturation factor